MKAFGSVGSGDPLPKDRWHAPMLPLTSTEGLSIAMNLLETAWGSSSSSGSAGVDDGSAARGSGGSKVPFPASTAARALPYMLPPGSSPALAQDCAPCQRA